jgi:hypothetical protein
MALSHDVTSSPGPGSTLEENVKYYKAQYELLESELSDFQASSKELEAELEKDIEASEKRERQLKEKASNLQYEVDEWKAKYKQAKSEAASAQTTLQKEITELRDTNRNLSMRLRDIEVANDDYERQQRNTESSLEDMESKYNQTLERSVMLEEEMRSGEQERESLRIEAQRLKDELSDFKIETDIIREKLSKAQAHLARQPSHLSIESVAVSASPRSELSPTTTDTSFDTPPAKTASSGISDTRESTPPSPPVSDPSTATAKAKPTHTFVTPSIPRVRTSLNGNLPTPRQPAYSSSRTSNVSHTRGPSIPAIQRTAPSSTHTRQSLGRGGIPQRTGLPQSSSIVHLRNLRSKMQNLEARVHNARSKLPGPVNTPPKASPRSGSALGNHAIPASVTVRSRKRAGGSTISGASQGGDSDGTPSIPRSKPSRTSLGQTYTSTNRDMLPPTPTNTNFRHNNHSQYTTDSSAAPSRPDSRASARHSFIQSRPGSRASISNLRSLGGGAGQQFAPNASTSTVRPKSALSSHSHAGGLDGTYDNLDDSSILEDAAGELASARDNGAEMVTPTPRRTSFARPAARISDVGSAIPSPVKRTSLGGAGNSRLPGPHVGGGGGGAGRRLSQTGLPMRSESAQGHRRPGSRASVLGGVKEGESGYDLNETF